MEKQQLEMTLEGATAFRLCIRRRRRLTRARWWFQQMRQAVDYARDWEPAPVARSKPVSITLSSAHRHN